MGIMDLPQLLDDSALIEFCIEEPPKHLIWFDFDSPTLRAIGF